MRPLVCEIRLEHLRHNYRVLKEKHGGKLLAVVKANAYGHGAVRCALALHDIADGFAVAFLEEAIELRENGITKPIVLLEGAFDAQEYHLIEQWNLWTVVHNQVQLEDLLAHDWKQPATVWLKMDSGMHRAGFFPHHYAAAYTALSQSNKVGKIVKMSHFACADDAERGMTEMQIEAFDLACADLAGESSLANSAAI
ncbi:alanine racemase, partial [Kingella kingae]